MGEKNHQLTADEIDPGFKSETKIFLLIGLLVDCWAYICTSYVNFLRKIYH